MSLLLGRVLHYDGKRGAGCAFLGGESRREGGAGGVCLVGGHVTDGVLLSLCSLLNGLKVCFKQPNVTLHHDSPSLVEVDCYRGAVRVICLFDFQLPPITESLFLYRWVVRADC